MTRDRCSVVGSLGAVPTPDAAAPDHQTARHEPDHESELDVSVVLPVYNERGHLREEIDRIRAALDSSAYTYEIVVVDDGSDDGSEQDLPTIEGFEIGRVYEAGTGMMAGDFYDVFRVGPTRTVAVIGDVTGHGIEPSITAFQAKYLLRVFLRQYRDPAQALEELNAQLSALERDEEMISLCVVVFDTEADTIRYASAGHPAVWLWHEKDVRPLRSTGPLLMLDPRGTYHSRELRLDSGDLILLYTDGLSEARAGDQLFGEDRIANAIRRDPAADPDQLVTALLEAARDFARDPITDDIAILAVRRE